MALVHAAGIVTDGSTATTVTTVNQVDVVNIATPTAGGVSQNHFNRFSIDTNGAVMNNSTVNGTSNLAGQVQANSNLNAGAARIILNEVTSNKQSNLNGTTEIFGDNARYILSNPNGITCDGCGFIRTPTAIGDSGTRIQDVFLTTGKASVNATNGLPVTLSINNSNQAQLIIGQKGLDASHVDITTLLTRRAAINGLVNAASSQLNLYLGKGTLSVNDNAASSWVTDSSGNTVNVAIDANSAGAMNAGQIFIQSTEDGAGVTLPNSLVSTGGISISAAGDIVYQDATAQAGDMSVTANGTNNTITSTGTTTASANVTLSGIDDVSYKNITAQNGNVTVSTQTANAQITASGNTTASNNITLNISGSGARVNGSGGSSSAVTFSAANTILLNCTVSDGSCDVQSQRALIFQSALLQSNANITTTSGNNLTVNAAVSSSQGFNSGAHATFASTSGDINIAGSLIATNNISLTSAINAQIILDGNVQAGGNIAFLGQGSYVHDNVGSFTIGGTYQFDLFSLTNNDRLTQLQNGTLKVKQLVNNGLIENQAALNLQIDDSLNNTGIIASLEGAVNIGHSNASLKTNSITNSGVIASIDLTNSQLGQTGLILDPAALIAAHTNKILNGEQRSATDLATEIETQNAALIAQLNANATATGVVTLNATTLNNTASGRISGSDVSLLVDNLNNQAGQILAGRNLTVQGSALNNSNVSGQFGVLTARENINLTLSNSFTNTGLVDGSNVSITAPTQNNTGSSFSIASLLGAKLDTTAQVNALSQKKWFEAGTGNTQYRFINAFNNSVIDSNLMRLTNAFIQSSGANIDANNKIVGDDVYLGELIVNTLRNNGGVPFVTAERDALGQLNRLYSNTQAFMTKTGLAFGQTPTAIQQSQISAPILVFAAQDQGNGQRVFVPQVWMPRSGEGINAQAGRISTQIIAANDLLLSGTHITNTDADLIAGNNLVIEADDLTLSGEARKWYVDINGQVHYRSAQVVAGNSVSVKLSGNYVQKGTQVLAKNQVAISAKTINISNTRKAKFNTIESFNTAGKEQKLWTSLLSMGLNRADNMLANRVSLKAKNDITLTRASVRAAALKQTGDDDKAHDNKHENKNQRHPEHEIKHDEDDENKNTAGNLSLMADNGSINNLASYLESDSIVMQAKKDINTKSLQHISSNTIVSSRWNRGWYDDDPSYSQTVVRTQTVSTDVAQINAGQGGLIQVAGNDINNLGGLIASKGDIIQQATGNINNKSLAIRYLENQRVTSSGTGYGWGNAIPRNLTTDASRTKYNTAIQLASISAKGNLYQTAGHKIINVGSSTTAGGNLLQQASKGIENKNLIARANTTTFKRAVRSQGYGYDDDDYYYRPAPKDERTSSTTQNAIINTINAGGSLVSNVTEGDYLNQGNLTAGKDIQISAKNITNQRQRVGTGNTARAADSGKMSAGNNLSLQAQNNITDTAGRYEAGGNIALTAKNTLTQNTLVLSQNTTNEQRSAWGNVIGYDSRASTTNIAGSFKAGNKVQLAANNNLTLTASNINAEQITLRGKNINLNAAKNTTNNRSRYGNTVTRNSSTRYDVVKLKSRGDTLVQADNDLITQGAQLIVGNQANNLLVLNAGNDMRLDSVNNETASYYHTSSSGWFSSSSTTRESQRVRSQGTDITAANLIINANKDERAINKTRNAKTNNVTFIGTQINVANDTLINANGDVNIYAGLDYNYDAAQSSKSSWFGLSNNSNGSRRAEQLLKAANLKSRQGDLSLLAGNNITVVASNLTAGKNLNLQADNNVLIAAAEQLSQKEDWSKNAGLFKGGKLYQSKENKAGTTSTNYIGSNLSAANDINLQASRAKVVGSSLIAANNINAQTDVGDIEVVSTANSQNSYHYQKDMNVSLGDFANNLVHPDKWFKTKNGRATMKIADATYNEATTKNSSTTQSGSVLQAGNSINLNAAGDITIKGSQLLADAAKNTNTAENGQGDINLTANGDINITSAKNTYNNQTKDTQGKAELSVVVQHQAVEVANAAAQLDKAKKQLKQANEDYRQYKKTLTQQKAQLAKLEQGYKNKEAGISYDDIRELREFIQSSEDDKDWYRAGIAAATLNLTSKSTLLIQQTAAAFQSTATYGFNAGVQLDIDATKTNAQQNQTQAIASILQGRNITLSNKGNTFIKGSQLTAANDLTINTNNLNIFASRDTGNSSNKTEQGTISIAQTVYGAASGPTVNASLSRSKSQNTQTVYTNSTLTAKNITLITQENATLRGANVRADNTLVANIGKDLTIESVQNTTTSKNNNFSISGGFGFGKKDGSNGKTIKGAVDNVANLGQNNGKVNSVNGGLSAGAGRSTTRQTVLSSLTSGGTADITVKGHTQINGALLATTDENNNDLGKLNLTTKSLGFEDFSNTRFSNNRNAGISSSVGLGKDSATPQNTPKNKANGATLNTTNIQYSNSTGYEKTKTLATLGNGNIQIANSDTTTLDRLNRDTKNISKDIFNTKRQQGNIDLTIDTRLFSKDGRNQILDDVKRTKIGWDAITDLGDKSVSFFGSGVGETSLRQNLMNKQDYFTAVKTFSADKKNEKYIETLSNGKASAKEKQVAYTQLANSVAVQLGIPLTQAKLLIQQNSNDKGYYSKENKTIYVVDNNNATTGDAVNTVGHEVAHHMDNSRNGDAAYTQTKTYKDNRDSYAEIMGEALEDYTSFAFAMNGYDSLTATNLKSGSRNALGRTTDLIQRNNTVFDSLDPNQIEHRQFNYNEAKILDQARYKIKTLKLSPEAQQLTVALLEASGCAKVRCADNVPKGDPKYKQLKQLQDFGDTLAEDSFDSLMAQLGVDKKYKVKVGRPGRHGGRATRTRTGFEYTTGDTVSDYAQAKTGDTIEAAQEIVQGGYEFAVFAGAETVKNIYRTKNTEGFANYMAEQVNRTWTDAETSSIGQTNVDSMQAGTWKPGQNIVAELALLGIEVVPLLKPIKAVKDITKVIKEENKIVKIALRKKAINKKINQRAQQKVFEEKIGFQHEKSMSGKKANALADKGQKEWNDTDIVKEGILPKGQKPDTIARTHRSKKRPEGPYLGDKSQMKSKTESQLKKEYALPKDSEYSYITDYKGVKKRKVQIGRTGKNDWGQGGNTQVKVKPGQPRLSPEDFSKKSTIVEK